jgi:hypothetical protein
MPFREMASCLWYLTWRLHKELNRRTIRDVFFFSKGGEFLKKIFDQLQQDIFGEGGIKRHCILVSRKATFLASLHPLEQEAFSRLFSHYRDISLRDFLLSLNIEESVAAGFCAGLQLGFETRITDLQNSRVFELLRQSKAFQSEYEKRGSWLTWNLI